MCLRGREVEEREEGKEREGRKSEKLGVGDRVANRKEEFPVYNT